MITREQYKDINYKPFLFFVVFGARGDQLEVSGSRHHVEGMPEGLEFNCLNRSEHADYIDGFFEGPLGDILQEENSDLSLYADDESVDEYIQIINQMIFYSGQGVFFDGTYTLHTGSGNTYEVKSEFVDDFDNEDFNNAYCKVEVVEE